MKLAGTRDALTLVEDCGNSHHLLQELRSIGSSLVVVDAEIVFAPEEEGRGIFEVGSIRGKPEECLVVDCDLSILKTL